MAKKKKEKKITEEFHTIDGYSPKEWFIGQLEPKHMKLLGLVNVQTTNHLSRDGSFIPSIHITWVDQDSDDTFGHMKIIPSSYNSVNVIMSTPEDPYKPFVTKAVQFSTSKRTDPIMKKVNRDASELYWNARYDDVKLAEIKKNPINDLFEYLGYSKWVLRILERAATLQARKLWLQNVMIQYSMKVNENHMQKFIENWADAIAYRIIPVFITYGPWVDCKSDSVYRDSLYILSDYDEDDQGEDDDVTDLF